MARCAQSPSPSRLPGLSYVSYASARLIAFVSDADAKAAADTDPAPTELGPQAWPANHHRPTTDQAVRTTPCLGIDEAFFTRSPANRPVWGRRTKTRIGTEFRTTTAHLDTLRRWTNALPAACHFPCPCPSSFPPLGRLFSARLSLDIWSQKSSPLHLSSLARLSVPRPHSLYRLDCIYADDDSTRKTARRRTVSSPFGLLPRIPVAYTCLLTCQPRPLQLQLSSCPYLLARRYYHSTPSATSAGISAARIHGLPGSTLGLTSLLRRQQRPCRSLQRRQDRIGLSGGASTPASSSGDSLCHCRTVGSPSWAPRNPLRI